MTQNDIYPAKTHYNELPISFHIATSRDIQLLEWRGEYTHLRKVFRRALMHQHRGHRLLWVARYKNYPIGRLFVLLRSPNSFVADGRQRAYLYSFRVMDEFQGMGIGTQLMELVETQLIEHGFELATIAVAKTNYAAIRLYQRRGYEIFTENSGEWEYYDHQNKLRKVMEPCWMLEKALG